LGSYLTSPPPIANSSSSAGSFLLLSPTRELLGPTLGVWTALLCPMLLRISFGFILAMLNALFDH